MPTQIQSPAISVVVPVFNSETTLAPLAERLGAVLEACAASFEVIFVDDGSRDGSWRQIGDLSGRYPWVRGLRLMRNYGQHNALLRGIRAARHEIVITLDDDLQNPPEEIPKLLGKLAEGFDVVYGTAAMHGGPPHRAAGSWLLRLILRTAMNVETLRHGSAFRAFRTELRRAFAHYQSPFVSIDVLLTWGTSRFASVPVRHDARREGQSNYTFLRLLAFAIDVTTGFSTRPLRFASMVGFAFTLFGMGVLAWVLGRFLWLGYSLPGFPFLASVIAIFSGAQLFALGIIGEYLARMHLRSMGRPSSVVGESVGIPPDRRETDDA